MRVLVVEDDRDMAGMLARGLAERAYAVDVAATGAEALAAAAAVPYDVIVLDAMIPPPDGFEVCRTLRGTGSDTPILMLTARDAVEDRVAGLDAGADDYLVKPFEFPELLARLRAMLRRGGARRPSVLRIDDLVIDSRSHRVTRGGRDIELTSKEYALLEYLAVNAGRVLDRAEIAEHVWNEDFDAFTNLIEVYVGRLRRSIDRDAAVKLIHTVRGAGYILEVRP